MDVVDKFCNRCGFKYSGPQFCPKCRCPEFSLEPNVTSDGAKMPTQRKFSELTEEERKMPYLVGWVKTLNGKLCLRLMKMKSVAKKKNSENLLVEWVGDESGEGRDIAKLGNKERRNLKKRATNRHAKLRRPPAAAAFSGYKDNLVAEATDVLNKLDKPIMAHDIVGEK